MPFLITDYLNAIEPHLPPDLITPENLQHMRAITDKLPGGLTEFFGFECRPAEQAGQTDILFCIYERQRDIIAGKRPGMAIPDEFREHEVWQRLFEFCLAWADEASPLHDNIHNIWLEFDVDGMPPEIPVPGIFFGSETIKNSDDAAALAWVNEQAVPMLTGEQLSKTVERTMLDAIQALPEEAYVFQLGAMVSRTPAFVRLCIKQIKPEEVIPYLERINWPGDSGELSALIDKLIGLVDHVDVDIDVSEGIGPKVGLECHFEPRTAPKKEPRWQTFFDYLIAEGMCLPEKRDALNQYPGVLNEQQNRDVYPQSLLAASRIMGRRYYSFISHGIYHIKVVYQTGKALEAKAYLWVEHMWLSAAQLREINALADENTGETVSEDAS